MPTTVPFVQPPVAHALNTSESLKFFNVMKCEGIFQFFFSLPKAESALGGGYAKNTHCVQSFNIYGALLYYGISVLEKMSKRCLSWMLSLFSEAAAISSTNTFSLFKSGLHNL